MFFIIALTIDDYIYRGDGIQLQLEGFPGSNKPKQRFELALNNFVPRVPFRVKLWTLIILIWLSSILFYYLK